MEEAAGARGVSEISLAECAALQTARFILNVINIRSRKNRAVVVCGPGKNGGDGIAAARHLHGAGVDTTVYLLHHENNADEKINNLSALEKSGVRIFLLDEYIFTIHLAEADIILDALFGTGITRNIEGVYARAISLMNNHTKKIFSADLPSGIHPDTGQVMGAAICAAHTIAYGFPKPGHLLYPGAAHAGQVHSVPLMFNSSEASAASSEIGKSTCFTLDDRRASLLLPERPLVSHKGTFGKVAVYAGSVTMPGAALLCAQAAYRAGAGLVEARVIPAVADVVKFRLPEVIFSFMPEKNGAYAAPEAPIKDNATVIALGPGIGLSRETEYLAQAVLAETSCPSVMDADALTLAARNLGWLQRPNLAVTPHLGEMSRLTGCPVTEIENDPIRAARSFAARHGVVVLLKGARTVVASPDGCVYINPTGGPYLAKAGAGDTLTGIVAGLAAQGLSLFNACVLGAYLHGRAGAIAAERLGAYGVMATDIAERLGEAMHAL
jgi:NAD(P)H-hydrate epimerase